MKKLFKFKIINLLLISLTTSLSLSSCINSNNQNNNNNNLNPTLETDSASVILLKEEDSIRINFTLLNGNIDNLEISLSNPRIINLSIKSDTYIQIRGLNIGESFIIFKLNNEILKEIKVVVVDKSSSTTIEEDLSIPLKISTPSLEIRKKEPLNIDIISSPVNINSLITYQFIENNGNANISNNVFFASQSGVYKFQAKYKDIVSNIIEINVYDFDISLESNELDIYEEYSLEVDYTSYINELKIYIEDPSIINIRRSPFGDYYLETLKIGKTYFYFYNEIRNEISNKIMVDVSNVPNYEDISKDEFYKNYKVATSYNDAMERSKKYFMSGDIKVPSQEPTISSYRPKINDKYIHNSETLYSNNNNTYTVLDSNGNKAFDIYKGAAYTTLEEVAAYIYAFNDVPINYEKNKNVKPTTSPWEEYLRLNNNYFSGDIESYPFEPELPDISGCGGNLNYYEVDIGTLGTDCDPNYDVKIYNDGKKITRGAARIVYSKSYKNSSMPLKKEDRYVFYTFNHYNDFQEYLNYENGWGEMFGNITGGGVLSSKNPNLCNPTPYIETIRTTLI